MFTFMITVMVLYRQLLSDANGVWHFGHQKPSHGA